MNDNYINSVNLNNNTNFPYLVLNIIDNQSYPVNAGFRVMHWHEDIQFIYVQKGTIILKTLDDNLKIKSGEGIFINKYVVHRIIPIELCNYNSFIFPDYFLKFYLGSPAETFVNNITDMKNLPTIHFTNKINWHSDILNSLDRLTIIEKSKTDTYTYEVLVVLSTIWLELIKNINVKSIKSENITNIRMQKFLTYINEHYSEEISLEDLAKSANVSKSECLRCFKSCLDTTPYKYIIEFRLSKAANLLKNTNIPVSSIASAVGFNHISHFGKCFKEKTGVTPKEYRETKKVQNPSVTS